MGSVLKPPEESPWLGRNRRTIGGSGSLPHLERTLVLNIRNVPDDLMHKLKTDALAKRITLREHVIDLLETATKPSPKKS